MPAESDVVRVESVPAATKVETGQSNPLGQFPQVHVALEPAGTIAVQVQDHVEHVLDLVQSQLEGYHVLLYLVGQLVLLRGAQQLLVVQEAWWPDQHVAELAQQRFWLVFFDAVH